MSDKVINLGDYILENEPPLSPSISETAVSFPGPDETTITGIINAPLDKPITQKALFLHEIEGDADGGTMRVLARRYADMGIATLRIDFSGHGKRKNEWERYSPQSMHRDTIWAIDYMNEQWPRISKTMLCGFSTGGAIALMARVHDPRISKSCLLYPVLSFQYNFLAALENDPDLLKDWDAATPWRAAEFTKEKLENSLYKDAPFSLTLHTYGAGFIKGCKTLVDENKDIPGLIRAGKTPLTIIQGTHDFCVPSVLTESLCKQMIQDGNPVRHVKMKGMNHWVPREWKSSVITQFRKAAMTNAQDFRAQRVTISLRPQDGSPSHDPQVR